ncbi:hypothetical protein H2201_006422 [Coniosporium apollinis]|uniref:Aminoglycoside phosphotransferase domain-containing protein n=1 Tax=Coniosporium apollinis TaxID=61459 RepID=A0ABQ9NMX1_9PEZI|nr:hypothetical protein H2201_006422 [Coniosporium apollinis]
MTLASSYLFEEVSFIQGVSQGPFSSSHDWLRSRLTFIFNDQNRILTDSDGGGSEDAENARDLAQRLFALPPQAFPPQSISPEPTILFHDDLSERNVLVSEEGRLTAVVDWECVSALPLWRTCQVPAFLHGLDRDEEPHRDRYAADEQEDNVHYKTVEDALDNEGVNELYWIHVQEYQQTHLRRGFVQEVAKLEPSWVEESRKGAFKADFEMAVHNCDNGSYFGRIREWLDAVQSGESWSLRSRL